MLKATLDLNNQETKQWFDDFVEKIQIKTLEQQGFVYVADLGYIHKDARVCSELAARVLGIWSKSWKALLTQCKHDGLPVYRVAGGHQYLVSDLLEYLETKRF